MYLKTFGVVKYKDEEVRTMVNVTNTYLTATQIMEILGVSRATAYKTIHELNEELQESVSGQK